MVEIYKLGETFCEKVAESHLANLRTNFKGKSGVEILAHYYEVIARERGGVGYIAFCQNEFAGFICGVWDPSEVRRELLRKHGFVLGELTFFQLLRWPGAFLSFARRLSQRGSKKGVGYELRPIVVEPDFRGKEIAILLVNTLVKDCKNRGFNNLYLFTEEDNLAANKFYQKYGFKQTGSEYRDSCLYYRYEYSVNERK